MEKRVIFSVFAGRERYMRILSIYIDKLIANGDIQEVHLWDFTAFEADREFLKELCSKNTVYKLMVPVPGRYKWDPYYDYYINNIKDNEILIKCDDDILYIDINKFREFIDEVKEDVLYFPNIVNNDVCAYYQTKAGIHKIFDYNVGDIEARSGDGNVLTEGKYQWWTNFNKAAEIHELFLKDPSRFHLRDQKLIHYSNRVSINFFAVNARCVRKFFKQYFILNNGDDEQVLSSTIPYHFAVKNIINMNFCIVHFQFNKQNGFDLDIRFLRDYYKLANEGV